MEPRRHRLAVVLVGVVLVAALAPTMATARATVEVAVDGTPTESGERRTVTDDPVLDIEVTGAESIESVTIRVDGESRRSFEPNATTFSERVTLGLTDGDHEVAVVVDSTERWTATILKDSTAPLVTFTSPFESVGRPPTGQIAVREGATTLAADLDDQSGVREVRIERTYEWRFGGQSRRDLETYRIENPGDNVSQPILFGLGRNELHVVAVDVHGQRRTHDITVWVLDDQRPVIDLNRFERTGDTLHVAGTVRDNVKVNTLSYRVAGTAQKNFVSNPTSAEPTRSRLAVDFAFTVPISDSTEGIVLEATDVNENEREWTVPLDYRGHLEPRITITDARVNGSHVDVAGTVANGQVTRVVVESVGPDGDVVDSRTAYDGDATSSVEIHERLAAASDETTVVIRAVDTAGRDHRESVTLATPRVETPTDPVPTRTVTATPAVTTTASTPAATTTASEDDGEQPTTRGDGTLSTGLTAVGAVIVGRLLVAVRRQ
ncbi:hypothetical protein [Haloplanus aerogenes]|uniref:Uncharacterized protein n=1 Tax=Haloplanus aerogenes TaxID=660522 RepID=A0A3M0DAL8_9EURY|nr:hypothetical protein [Haloplanus aerogenes]AZH24099.1 hypothetical protein DU502_01330 [Haloplanus aerogenes]RMB13123.1 hypothetical protein ATH50_2454 [Haloplanus aerogenes]